MSKSIVLQKTLDGKEIVIRYPQETDVENMLNYINTLSREKTYIRFQGEQLTLKEEKNISKDNLKK